MSTLIKDPHVISWLIEEYRDNVVELRDSMLFTASDGDLNNTNVASGIPNSDTLLAVDELNRARKKLIDILEVSSKYTLFNYFFSSRHFWAIHIIFGGLLLNCTFGGLL